MICPEDKRLLYQMVWNIPEEARESVMEEIQILFTYQDYQEIFYRLEHLEIPADMLYCPYAWQINKFIRNKVKHPNN